MICNTICNYSKQLNLDWSGSQVFCIWSKSLIINKKNIDRIRITNMPCKYHVGGRWVVVIPQPNSSVTVNSWTNFLLKNFSVFLLKHLTNIREILGHNYKSNVSTLRRTSPSNDSGVNLRGVVLYPKLA